MPRRIAVVVGDIGATQELVPAVELLKQREHLSVTWITSKGGKACKVLEGLEISYSYDRSAAAYASEFDLIVVGTSATAVHDQIEWTQEGKKLGVPVLWYEDLWGTGELPQTRKVSPDLMMVIDDMAERVAQYVRPDLKTIKVGKPTFEKLHYFDEIRVNGLRRTFRQQAGVSPSSLILVYWGGGDCERVVAHLTALKDFDAIHRRQVFIAPRLHPKMPNHEKMWAIIRSGSAAVIDMQSVVPEELNCMADAVMGEYGSTQTYAAALAGILPIIALWPDNLGERLACGFQNGTPPMIQTRIAVGAMGHDQIAHALTTVTRGGILPANTRSLARQFFGGAATPGAAQRITDTICQCLP